MPIAVVCSTCSARLNAPDGAAGKKVKCPKCQTPIVVPDLQPMQFEVVEDEPAPARRPAGKPSRVKAAVEDDDRPRRKRRSEEEEDDEDDDDRPRKKKRRKGGDEEGGVSMTRNIVMGIVLIILIAVAAYIFYDRSQKQKEQEQQQSSSNANVVNADAPDHPSRNMPLPNRDSSSAVVTNQPVGFQGPSQTLNSPAGFKVTFPAAFEANVEAAEKAKEDYGLASTSFHVCTDGKTHLLAAHFELPSDSSSEERSNSVVTAMTRGRQSRDVGFREVELSSGEKGQEYTVATETSLAVLRFWRMGSRMYLIGVKTDNGLVPSDVKDKFLDSFKLTKPLD
jgi:LSD1 subclass zinc finger protein